MTAIKTIIDYLAKQKMISGEINRYISELLELSKNCTDPIDSDERSAFIANHKGKVREIGRKLYKLGGHNAMLSAWQQIPKHDQLELNHAWDMVGEWRI